MASAPLNTTMLCGICGSSLVNLIVTVPPPGADNMVGLNARLFAVTFSAAPDGAEAWAHLPFVHWPWPLPLIAAAVIYLPVSGFVTAEVVALYLLIASNAHVNFNELYAGQSIVDSKSFLRCHIGTDGALTIYPIAVDRVCRQWTVRPGDPAGQPWLQPAKPIAVKLAEPPIRIGKEPAR